MSDVRKSGAVLIIIASIIIFIISLCLLYLKYFIFHSFLKEKIFLLIGMIICIVAFVNIILASLVLCKKNKASAFAGIFAIFTIFIS